MYKVRAATAPCLHHRPLHRRHYPLPPAYISQAISTELQVPSRWVLVTKHELGELQEKGDPQAIAVGYLRSKLASMSRGDTRTRRTATGLAPAG